MQAFKSRTMQPRNTGKGRMALGSGETHSGMRRKRNGQRERRESAKTSHFAVDEMTEIEVVSPR